MSRSEKFFRHYASDNAQDNGDRDQTYRIVWEILNEAYGFEVANNNYQVITWITYDDPTPENVEAMYQLWVNTHPPAHRFAHYHYYPVNAPARSLERPAR